MDSGWTCFLAGLDGTLDGNGGADIEGNVAVYPPSGGGDWILSVTPDDLGDGLAARAVCLQVPVSSSTSFEIYADGTRTLSPTAGTECFLNSIMPTTNTDFDFGGTVSITRSGANWVLKMSTGAHWTAGATCIPVPTAQTYEIDQRTGTLTIPWADTQADPVACGLRGFEGTFSGEAGIGVNLDWPSAWGGEWMFSAAREKYGWFTCLQ